MTIMASSRSVPSWIYLKVSNDVSLKKKKGWKVENLLSKRYCKTHFMNAKEKQRNLTHTNTYVDFFFLPLFPLLQAPSNIDISITTLC